MNTRALLDRDVRVGLSIGLAVGVVLLLILLWHDRPTSSVPDHFPAPAYPTVPRAPTPHVEFGREPASFEARRLGQWVAASADHGGRSFVIVDKRDAKVFVFEPGGRLVGATPVLLGFAAGDEMPPGSASKALNQMRPEERITPAGRFVSRAGRNAEHEDVVWVDYAAAVSMHRVRRMHASERRAERLASPTSADNRISSGCINVPIAFFENVLWPRLGRGRQGVIYVLPESRPLAAVFPALAPAGRALATPAALVTAD